MHSRIVIVYRPRTTERPYDTSKKHRSSLWLAPDERILKNCAFDLYHQPVDQKKKKNPPKKSILTPVSPRHTTMSLRPMSPTSLNYVSANTAPRPPLHASRKTKPETLTKAPSKRHQFRAKAKKLGKFLKNSLKSLAYLCRQSSRDSDSSTLKDLHSSVGSRISLNPASVARASTPSILRLRPMYCGSNVRLSVHRIPPSPRVEAFGGLDANGPSSGNASASGSKRKSMRFVHPVVSGVISDDSLSISASVDSWEASSEEQQSTLRPTTAETVSTLDFENQVNPKRVHKSLLHSKPSFNTFKNVLDGAAKPQPAPPTLPYIPMTSNIGLEDSRESSQEPDLAALAAHVQADYVLPGTSKLPTVIIVAPPNQAHHHPSTLTPGNELAPTLKPRTTAPRPHTMGNLNFLPYVPLGESFNPYASSSTSAAGPADSTRTKLASQKQASNTSLSAAFAEREAEDAAIIHKRHTVLYEEVEKDFLLPTVPAAPAAATPTPTPIQNQNNPSQIKRKPVAPPKPATNTPNPPVAPLALPTSSKQAARKSKELPPLPSPNSPRRFTQVVDFQGAAPERLRMNGNGYPVLRKAVAGTPKREMKGKQRMQYGGGERKVRDARSAARARVGGEGRAGRVHAVESALDKLMF